MKWWITRFSAVFGTLGLIGVFWLMQMSLGIIDQAPREMDWLLSIPFVLLIIFSIWKWNSDKEYSELEKNVSGRRWIKIILLGIGLGILALFILVKLFF